MNRIYLSDNYIIVEEDGLIKPFSKGKSEYNEAIDHFSLRKFPNKEIIIFKFTELANWTNENGIAYTVDTLKAFLRQNTGFNTASGGSGATFAELDYVRSIENSKGTISFTDTQYTEQNRLQGSSGVLLALPNNKGIISNKSAPIEAVNWVNNLGELVPETSDGDTYLGRITFEIDPILNNRNLRMFLDIGDGNLIDILGETKRLARGANNDTSIMFDFKYFTGLTFLANNGRIFLDVDGDYTIYNIVYVITRIKKVNI